MLRLNDLSIGTKLVVTSALGITLMAGVITTVMLGNAGVRGAVDDANAQSSLSLSASESRASIRGSIVPLVYLGDVFDVPGFARDPAECTVIVIEGSDRARLGLVVDELCGHQQVVIKSIEENYGSVPGIAAATILGNGRVAFIVDIEKLSDLLDAESRPAAAARTSQAA